MSADRTAVCARDGEPLVLTFEMPGYEFVCVVCGLRYTFFGPAAAESTPELEARHDELVAQFRADRETAS